MSSDFQQTANSKGTTERRQVVAAVRSLQATAQNSSNETERLHAKLMLERLGLTLEGGS